MRSKVFRFAYFLDMFGDWSLLSSESSGNKCPQGRG